MKNKNEIMKSVSGVINKTTMTLKKHSPEILVVAGVVGAVASAVIACKAIGVNAPVPFVFPRNEPKRVKALTTWDFSHVLACYGTRRSKQQPNAAKTNYEDVYVLRGGQKLKFDEVASFQPEQEGADD